MHITNVFFDFLICEIALLRHTSHTASLVSSGSYSLATLKASVGQELPSYNEPPYLPIYFSQIAFLDVIYISSITHFTANIYISRDIQYV